MNILKTAAILFIFLTPAFLKSQPYNISQFNWLDGNWSTGNSKMSYYEIWEKTSMDTISGHGFMISNKDTIFSEKLRVYTKEPDIYYAATVSDQNEGKTIPFKLVIVKDDIFIFENKGHDFPDKISYIKKSNNKILVVAEGYQNGKHRKEKFPLKRIKNKSSR